MGGDGRSPLRGSGHSDEPASGLAATAGSVPNAVLTLFGERFDKMARRAGGWPKDAVAYAVEIVGQGKNPMVLITGEVPVGTKRDGRPKFGTKQRRYQAGVRLSQYRAALSDELPQ